MSDKPKIPAWQAAGFASADEWAKSITDKALGGPTPDTRPKRKRKAKTNGEIGPISLAEKPQDNWMDRLQRGNHGYKANDYNAAVALTDCPELMWCYGYDTRTRRYVALEDSPAGKRGDWDDSHTATLTIWLQGLGIPITMRHLETAMGSVVRRNEVDPLGDYLNHLTWDGIPRIGTWLTTYCQAEASDANSIIGSKWLIGAAARALNPGCRMDYMLILEGDQGTRKSTAIGILGGAYAGENLPDFHSRDAMQITGSKWIIEVGELAATRKSDTESIKAFITRREDTYVPKYAKHPITVKRWSVLIGNLNPDGNAYLQDSTGNRRFWPVKVGEIDIEALKRDRDQIWAEAVWCYKRGDAWWPTAAEEIPVAAQQEERRQSDDWTPAIAKWWASEHPLFVQDRENGMDVGTTTSFEVATKAIGLSAKDITRSHQTRIGTCMKELGFLKRRVRAHGSLIWEYFM